MIPAFSVQGGCLAEAWEAAVVKVARDGSRIQAQYDDQKDSVGKSLDATVMIHVSDALAEPRVHKNIPAGPEELWVYRQEVVNGIHDHWIEPAAGKWSYTYHHRLNYYDGAWYFEVNTQLDSVQRCLLETPYSRRAQAITWVPCLDLGAPDPPCLQRLWFRISDTAAGPVLNMNSHWRSRDLYKAWMMNAFALTELQAEIAGALGVGVGSYTDISDSLHIYGSYQDGSFWKEVAKYEAGWSPDRAYSTGDLQDFFSETEEKLRVNRDYMRGQ